jgi:hypothetical protein
MKLHKLSLFGAVVGALIFTAALAPRANAALIVYFNFEDATTGGAPDFVADTNPPNPGGGQQASTITTNYTAGNFTSVDALAIASTNRTAADIDTTANQAVNFNKTTSNNGKWIQFTVNSTFLQDLSLSFAIDNNGNGFNAAQLSYSTDGGTTFTNIAAGAFTFTTGPNQLIVSGTFNVPQQPGLILRLTFSGGQSNGNNRQTVIDNIQLNATVIPEPATVASGLLGLCGLCWHQRRRLLRSLCLRRA